MLRVSDHPTSVYVATDDRGWCKIGHTGDPPKRQYHLARDRGCPVRMIHVEPCRPKAEIVEVAAHWILQDAENHHEWFKVDEATALNALRLAVSKVSAGHIPHARFWTGKRKTLAADLDAQARAALAPGETISQFIREAVERELERREGKGRS